jgi:[glutamine synthetase] adenylyltransferase / [glutamine synthetase]-adenylyl-L-tyrosine phosphorylase
MALERTTSLSELAGYGFINLEPALKNLEELVALIGDRARPALAFVAKAQNPDQSLELLLRLSRNHTSQLKSFCAKASHLERLCLILGSSSALFEFLDRHIEHLSLLEGKPSLPTLEDHSRELMAQAGSVAQIRIGYRKQLTKIASFDIEQLDPVAGVAKLLLAWPILLGQRWMPDLR